MTLVTLRRWLEFKGERSRSPSDGRRNLVNARAPEPLQEFEPKPTQILHLAEPPTDKIFDVMGSLSIYFRS